MKILGVVIPNTTYKVFTALLRQSGGDNLDSKTDGLLTIGVTYLITNNEEDDGWDFTNVGAPSNDVGTYFIATGTTPANWYNGYLEYNTGAPVVTVLENTIGNIWFTYSSEGFYSVNSDGLFILNKSIGICIPNQYVESPTDLYNYQILNLGVNNFYLNSTINYIVYDGMFGTYADNSIEIRVYN